MNKFIVLGMIVAGSVSTLTACGEPNTIAGLESSSIATNEDNSINPETASVAGEYIGIKSGFVGDDIGPGEEFSLILNEDGTGTNKRDGQEFICNWSVDGDKFTMKDEFMGVTIDYTGTIKDSVLEIYNGEPENEFTYKYVYEKSQ